MMYAKVNEAIDACLARLKYYGQEVDTDHWQGTDQNTVTRELVNVSFSSQIPAERKFLADLVLPNLPWAEDHFQERVGRVPSNPGEQYKNWPYWRGGHLDTKQQFTHTYQERFWPKGHTGIRFGYGDLDDVVGLLKEHPTTRQAYLPVYFPEDTGSVHGGRVPCTLGYGFLLRDRVFNCFYTIRSCDAVRHFRDDVYMAGRLLQWVQDECIQWHPAFDAALVLHFQAFSFHCFKGDIL